MDISLLNSTLSLTESSTSCQSPGCNGNNEVDEHDHSFKRNRLVSPSQSKSRTKIRSKGFVHY